jgi:hypothetical protein
MKTHPWEGALCRMAPWAAEPCTLPSWVVAPCTKRQLAPPTALAAVEPRKKDPQLAARRTPRLVVVVAAALLSCRRWGWWLFWIPLVQVRARRSRLILANLDQLSGRTFW